MIEPQMSVVVPVYSVEKEYFEEGTMIGWMLCRPGARMVIDTKIFNTHEKYFSEKNTIFMKESG